MAVKSLFGARNALRQILPTQATAQVFREVRTEDELRVALQPAGSDSTLLSRLGRRIVITAPITLKSPIIIDASLPGTTIESHGMLPITPASAGFDAFIVRAKLCTIRDMLIYFADVDGALIAFRRAVTVESSANISFRMRDVEAYVDESLVIDEGTSRGSIEGCMLIGLGGVAADGVHFNGLGWRIQGNALSAVAGSAAVRSGTAGATSAIVGNFCGNRAIDTSAGIGSSTISANTTVSTITNHATDAVGLNT